MESKTHKREIHICSLPFSSESVIFVGPKVDKHRKECPTVGDAQEVLSTLRKNRPYEIFVEPDVSWEILEYLRDNFHEANYHAH